MGQAPSGQHPMQYQQPGMSRPPPQPHGYGRSMQVVNAGNQMPPSNMQMNPANIQMVSDYMFPPTSGQKSHLQLPTTNIQMTNSDEQNTGPFNTSPVVLGSDHMVWDHEKGGYWIRDGNGVYEGHDGGYIVQPGRKIIKTTECCDDEIVMVKKKKKKCESDSEDEEPIIVVPPPVFLVSCPQGKSTFFPLVRNRPYQMETQQTSAGVAEASCASGACSRPCGGGGGWSGGVVSYQGCGPCSGR